MIDPAIREKWLKIIRKVNKNPIRNKKNERKGWE
jgi:hypothetical protein